MPLILPANEDGVARAVSSLRGGGVVVYPTETVYGIGVDPFHPSALERIFTIKGRDQANPVLLLVRNLSDLAKLTPDITPIGRRLIEHFWPGPLTLVFRAVADLPPGVTGHDGTVALRQSASASAASLADGFGGPITSTSANRSGKPPVVNAEEAVRVLGDEVDVILDGGPARNLTPSTVVDVTGSELHILREGGIAGTELDAALRA